MKKGIILFLILSFFIYFFISQSSKDNEIVSSTLINESNKIKLNDSLSKDIKLNSNITYSNESIDYATMSKQELKKFIENNPSGIIISSLEESDLSDHTKALLREKFKNLKEYGSFNKGKLSNEFKNIKKYKEYKDIDRPTSFLPTELDFINQKFDLTGKYYSGVYSEDQGYDSYTRLYENFENGQKIELVETYLNPRNHSTVQRFKESFNRNIGGVDLTWQEINLGNKVFYSVDFSTNQKDFSLSTVKLDRYEVEKIVYSLIKESKAKFY